MMKKKQLFLLTAAILASFFVKAQTKSEWKYLFNGKNLDGWTVKQGSADYKVKDGAIVGIAKINTPNTFLCTKNDYSDFILEFEIFISSDVNSGVQFRSNSKKDYKHGKVHGYQFDIDPTQRSWTGGIYDEGRRGWLYPLEINPKSKEAFQFGKWNKCRIEAVGTRIRTWVNGIQCVNLVDDVTASGFIGLQVHSIGKKSNNREGAETKWKNIRIKTTNLEQELSPIDVTVKQANNLVNTLTNAELRNGWRLLWDGKTTKGWIGAKLDHFPKFGWTIKDGELTINGKDGKESAGPGDIITEDVFTNFELELEFKITKGANSGIKYFVDPDLNKGEGSAIGCEFQILDDINHPDAKKGTNGNRTLGSLYDLITAKNEFKSKKSIFRGIGRWNKARIVVKDGKVSHWLNYYKVVEYDRFSQMFKALVAYSKYNKWSDFGQNLNGHILLQDHGDTVHYRSVKIRELN